MADFGAMWNAAPLMSRTLAASSLIVSFTAHALNLISPGILIYSADRVFNMYRPEIWRLVTTFLLTQPGMSILSSPFMLFRYASDCENQKFPRPADFLLFIIFLMGGIISLNTLFFGGGMYLEPLSFAFSYYSAAFQPASAKVNFYVIAVPVKLVVPLLLLINFVQMGIWGVLLMIPGLLSAHAYLFLTEIWPQYGGGPAELLRAPEWLHARFESPQPVVVEQPPPPPIVKKRAGSIMNLGSSSTGTSTQDGGSSSGSSMFGLKRPDGWSHRGAGHKLGS